MEKLVKKEADYLDLLREHGSDRSFFSNRFSSMDASAVRDEAAIVRALARHGMIEPTEATESKPLAFDELRGHMGETVRIVSADVTYPCGFELTPDGAAYREERAKEAAEAIAGIVVASVLGGFFAWVFLAVLPL